MTAGLFITGTDTGVGKTAVACALAAWARSRGVDVGVMKPVGTGGRWLPGVGRWVSDDALALAAAAGSRDPWALVNPVCFREPLAPTTAARRARAVIQPAQLLRAFHQLCRRHELVIVEGVGGLRVPLTARLMVSDLARGMRLPLVVVSRPGLGTLNHTLLTLHAAAAARLRVAGVVFNEAVTPARDRMARVSCATNPDAIAATARVPVAGVLPFRRGLLDRTNGRLSLAQWVDTLDSNWLRAWLLSR